MAVVLAPPARPGEVLPPSVHRRGVPIVATPIATMVALVLWIDGARRIDLERLGGLGLAGSLRCEAWIGLLLLSAMFVVELSGPEPRRRLLATQMLMLVFMLDGLAPMVESGPNNPVAFIHVGFVNYILQHGNVLHHFDDRFSWPGAFSFAALLTKTAGRSSALGFASWTPPVFDAIILLPLWLVARRLTPSPRVAWVALWLFVVGNWFGEDYFSPQGLAYVAAMVIIAVVLTLGPVPVTRRVRRSVGSLLRQFRVPVVPLALPRAHQRIAVTGAVILIAAAIAMSHQLTPFALALVLGVLALSGRLSWRALPLVTLILAIAWLSLGAGEYWIGHLSVLTGGVGSVGATLQQNTTGRTHGSQIHLVVIYARIALSGGLLGLAVLASVLRHRRGQRGWLVELLVAAPFSLLILQSYGGELIIRAGLFSLPFVGVLIAGALPHLRVPRPFLVPLATLCATALAALLLLTRYGNEPFYLSTTAEVAAVNAGYRIAIPGSTIAVFSANLPWRDRDLDRVSFVSYEAECGGVPNLACVVRVDADVIIVTAGQRNYGELVQGMDAAQWRELLTTVLPAAGYRLAFSNTDGQVYVHRGVSVPLTTGNLTYLKDGRVQHVT
jgi:hypothetical protein